MVERNGCGVPFVPIQAFSSGGSVVAMYVESLYIVRDLRLPTIQCPVFECDLPSARSGDLATADLNSMISAWNPLKNVQVGVEARDHHRGFEPISILLAFELASRVLTT